MTGPTPTSARRAKPCGMRTYLLLALLALGCASRPPAPPAAPPAAEGQADPWAGGRGSVCEPGQVNDLGVGRECTTNDDCRGLPASMCQRNKGPDRPSVCSVHCDRDADCGEGAMCGLARGWIRACYPKRCTDFAYDPARVRPLDGPPAAHAGAIVCDPGFSFVEEGYGKACASNADCDGLEARGCNGAIYPPGVLRCARECRTDAKCGAHGYCSMTEVSTFSECLQRCPEPRHLEVRAQPAGLDRCLVAGTVADLAKNEHGIGRACTGDDECGAGGVCGPGLPGEGRRPEGCTRPCEADGQCGRNALCVDLDHGTGGPPRRYCIPACWAV